jgi:hypothetical protein
LGYEGSLIFVFSRSERPDKRQVMSVTGFQNPM